MNKSIKCVIYSVMAVIFLLTACAPAPAPTQDPALAQQVIDQSIALTVAAESAQTKDKQLIEQAVALTIVAQNAQATEQQASTAAAATLAGASEMVETLPDLPETDPTATPSAQASESASNGAPDANAPVIESVTPPEGSVRGGDEVVIIGQNFIVGRQRGDNEITQFFFGENQATGVTCDLPTRCKVKSPAGKEGIVIVTALNGDAKSQHTEGNSEDGFKYNGIPSYGCDALTVTPKNLTHYKGGEGFVIKWIIANSGDRAWPAGMDVKYSAGVKMSIQTVVEIPIIMEPHDTYTIKIDAVAPDNPGTYYMTWIVEGMGCNAYVAIVVE